MVKLVRFGLLLAALPVQTFNLLSVSQKLFSAGDGALATLGSQIQRRQNFPNGPCLGNTATTRSKWCSFNIDHDWYEAVPTTGVTREYWFVLSDHRTVSPDGVPRYAQTINGTMPGPTLFADWGDYVVVHLTNNLSRSVNGTSLHFHGMRQLYTAQNDGVASITQCPTPPGSSMTYRWRATQYGTSWYHSHFGLQAWAGMYGGIVINGPASADYDHDLGSLFLSDWSHETPDALFHTAQTTGPPVLSNGLINGTNVYGEDGSGNQTGSRFTQKVTAGESYRFRLVNSAIDSHFRFAIDNHTLTVIAADLVPIKPYTTTMVSIGIGQRYDVIVTADQGTTAGAESFWMRAIPQTNCTKAKSPSNIKGIIHYGAKPSTPKSTGHAYTDSCLDEDRSRLVPMVPKDVADPTWTRFNMASWNRTAKNLVRWYLNGTSMEVDWSNPTLAQMHDNTTAYKKSHAVAELDKPDAWIYVAVETNASAAHPLHLHGFDFYVLAQGPGRYHAEDASALNLDNPPRRDTAMLPAWGHVVLAFKTDNPGAWLMHCHIGWHTSEGFAMQFVVRKADLLRNKMIDHASLDSTCAAWKRHVAADGIVLADSGV
ncbi:uncharacterized protein PpBr36_09537 [Pyricularia pennisetigena]|uniref:uncharacterized protein n=1 Tax=Pyricularia pennisetigena TaxID=1578925 RepID=UPI001151B9EC|nr:uncharacterized protein PpBr36_09537 [Pyricularia pennisetigena]TLS22038.1 hypothetical protein PpBr36_09537 [Pyricularia pennisetigena]